MKLGPATTRPHITTAAGQAKIDEMRSRFREAYRGYVETGQRTAAFLNEIQERGQVQTDLATLVALQAEESAALARYAEARSAYVNRVLGSLKTLASGR